MNQENTELGPERVSFATFLLKILAAGVGGSAGAIVLLLIFLFAGTLLGPLTGVEETTSISPIFVFLVIVMTFLASTVGNILSVFLMSLTEKGKYTRTSSAIYQIFILSVLVFLLMVPVYFLTLGIDTSMMGYTVALHIIITAQASALILEIISNYKYALVGLYSVTFSIIVSAIILFALYGVAQNITIVLFAALPVVWGSIAFVHSIVTMLYGWIARTYDQDFLATTTVYGEDYGKKYVSKEDRTPKAKDEKGGDFLRHN